jgi:hypothetical protein
VLQASCLCGAVRFSVPRPGGGITACHCSQCRKTSGHVWASTDVSKAHLTMTGAENLRWYQSSEKVRRGFCGTCGSALFWDPVQRDTIGVAMGAFDQPTGTHLHVHIFTADKGDYYKIADGVPQFATVPPRPD